MRGMTPLATNAIEFAAPTLPSAEVESGFADPDWRGEQRDPDRERAPLASLVAQAGRLEDWIRGGACYGWLDTRMADRAWAAGERFTLADCAAAPTLFYADWVHPIGDAFPDVAAYRARLLARPSVKRVVDEARPFRPLFPGGAPGRD